MPGLRASPLLGRALVVVLLAAACAGSEPGGSLTTSPALGASAVEFAVSAERALDGTRYETLGPGAVADLVRGLCAGLGAGAIPATIEGLGGSTSDADSEILGEVLATGMAQVCPDRSAVDLTPIYLETVRSAAAAQAGSGSFEEAGVVRAAPVVCEALDAGDGVEAALLAAVTSLYGVEADDVDDLSVVLDGGQGLVAGAVLASATALVCPRFGADVESFMESL